MTFTDLLARFAEVTPESNGYVALCPAHDDSRPSLRLAHNAETKKVMIRCRTGCAVSDVLDAVGAAMPDLFDVEPGDGSVLSAGRVEEGASVADIAAIRVYLDKAAAVADPAALEYAERRFGVTADRFTALGLGFDDGTLSPPARLHLSSGLYHDTARLVVPFYDFDGVAHYLQARSITAAKVRAKWSGPTNPEGAAWGKYGFLKGGTGWNDVIVTEGPGDALTAAAVGYDALGIRGAALGNNVKLADEVAAGLAGRRVLVAGDADDAGQKFTREVAQALSERGANVHRLVIPADAGSDLTDWREATGASFVKTFIKSVQEAAPYGADDIAAEAIAQDLTRLFTDVYNARALLTILREGGGDVRYTPEIGFVVYDSARGIWEPDATDSVRRNAHKVAERVQKSILREMSSMDTRVAAIADKVLREETGKLVDKQRAKARSGSLITNVLSTRGIDAMVRELRALDGVSASLKIFDQHHHLLAVGNGVVDLEKGTLLPYSEETRELYLMKHIDTNYRPEATNPRWARFLTEIFPAAPDMPAYMRRLVGYGITGYTAEQSFAVLFGTGANGKSVLTETLSTVFEGITTTTSFSTFESKPSGGIPNDVAALNGARLVMTSEGEQGRQMDEAVIKRVTGQDAISARFMRREFFEFRPTFLILMASNYKPNFRGQDEGLWRRVKLISFARYFAKHERDPYLVQKFTGQRVPANAWHSSDDLGDGAEGILAWAAEGAREWFRVGLQDPPSVTSATEEYRETSDALAGFYSEHLVKEERAKIKGKDVWELYQLWCQDEALERREQWKRSTFWSALEERGARKSLPSGVVTFTGIRRRRADDHHPDSDPVEEPRTPAADPAHFSSDDEVERLTFDPSTF